MDWSTLCIAGPDEVIGRHGITWYEWTAAVEAGRWNYAPVDWPVVAFVLGSVALVAVAAVAASLWSRRH